ncbi:MAG: hypothetical protein AABZ47_05815 [Planctomycetota bacterium]
MTDPLYRKGTGGSKRWSGSASPMMLRPIGVLAFFVKFVVVFGVLVWPWTVVTERYPDYFRALGNGFLSTLGSSAVCRVEAGKAGEATETVLKTIHAKSSVAKRRGVSSYRAGFVPTVFVAALVLATPVRWKRKLLSLLLGLVLMQLFIAFRLLLSALYDFAWTHEPPLFIPGLVTGYLLSAAFYLFVVSAVGSFIMPVFIWTASTFRKSDWPLFQRLRPNTASLGAHHSGAT